ncbi:MAG: hypothetical protein JWO08_1065, partial [Verrucomicrobiaceae bacterium]|nr:hypothetical protein [Verrucomicrobiaceae bacterium]
HAIGHGFAQHVGGVLASRSEMHHRTGRIGSREGCLVFWRQGAEGGCGRIKELRQMLADLTNEAATIYDFTAKCWHLGHHQRDGFQQQFTARTLDFLHAPGPRIRIGRTGLQLRLQGGIRPETDERGPVGQGHRPQTGCTAKDTCDKAAMDKRTEA